MRYELNPPFEIYHDGNNIADTEGHLCTADGPAQAEAILAALNSNQALVKALKEAKAFMTIEQLSPAEHSFEIEKRNVFRKQLFDQIDAAIAVSQG